MKQSNLYPLDNVLLRLLFLRLFLPLVVVTLLTAGAGSYMESRRLGTQQRKLVYSLANGIDDYLDQASRVLKAVSLTTETSTWAEFDRYLQATWRAYGYFDALYRIDRNGIVLLSAPFDPRYHGLDMSNQPYFQLAKGQTRIVISQPFTSLRTGRPTVYMAQSLPDGGLTVGELSLGALQRTIAADRDLTTTDIVFVADRSGTLLAHPRSDLVAQQASVGDLEIVERGLQDGVTMLYFNRDIPVLGSAVTVKRTGWVVVTEVPLLDAMSPLIGTVMMVLLLSVLFWLALTWTIRLQLRRHVVAPLTHLSGVADALAAGDYAQGERLAASKAVFSEIAVLTDSFQRMSNAIQARQAALQESEEKYRSLIEQSGDAIYLLYENQFEVINSKFQEILGVTPEQVNTPGFDFMDLVAPQSRDLILQRTQRLAQGQDMGSRYEFTALTQDGRRVEVEVSVSYISYQGGVATQGVLRDITERKRTEAEILRLQHLLQNITDSMPSALITLDLDGRVLTWNPAAEYLVGEMAGQVQGQLLWSACSALVRYRPMVERVLQEGRMIQLHKEPFFVQDRERCCDVSIFPLQANEMEGVVLRIDDVTRRVQLEDAMLQSAKMASVGGLAAGVAHEINNPLGAIMQSAQMLQMALDADRPRTRERLQSHGVDPDGLARYFQARGLGKYLDGIRGTGARAAKIVADLLSFARKSPSHLELHDLNALVKQTLDLAATDYDLMKKYDFRNIHILHQLAPGLPKIQCDGQQIQQVILNLVRNAAQEMVKKREEEHGIYQPRLVLRTMQKEGQLRLEVQDNGTGLSAQVRERLFEPFFTTKDVGEGTGLGLWLCWAIIVERHNGTIWAEPAPEEGTCFVIELPTM